MAEALETVSPTKPQQVEARQRKQRVITRGLLAAGIGNVLEWYDWTVYASLAVFFASDIFPSESTTAALLKAFLIFALGFAIRPLGGWMFGTIADHYGRRTALSWTIGLMGVGSIIVAITPSYGLAAIGAALILILGRLIQGLAYGGEIGSASAYIVEIAPDKHRGLFSSSFHFSVGIGLLFGAGLITGLTTVLNHAQMVTWGWRIPFLIGGLAGLVGLWIRRHVAETDPFLALAPAERTVRFPLLTVFKKYPLDFFRICGLGLAGTLSFYLFVAYLPTYAHITYGIDLHSAFLISTVGLAAYTLSQPLYGLACDKWGHKPLALLFSVGTAIAVVPLMTLLLSGSLLSLLVVQVVGLLLLAALTSVTPIMMAEQFPTEVRTVGIGVPYAITIAIFGGTTPYLLTWLASKRMADVFFWYVLVASVISAIAFTTFRDLRGKPLH